MSYERIYFIYKYTFPNGKVYIGQTYKGSGRFGKSWGYKTQLVYRAMLKYPLYKKEVLEYCDSLNVDSKEQYYIKKFNSMDIEKGYNQDSGGNERKEFSKRSRRLISEAHSGQKILQYDLEGNLLGEWEYINIASEILNINSKNISACLHGKSKSCNGYQWRFKDDDTKVKKYEKYDNRRKVNQYTLEGLYLKTWDSIIDIVISLKIDSAGIIKCCRNQRKKCNNYQWKYYEGNIDNISKYNKTNQKGSNNRNAKCVYQFDLYGSLIKKWSCISEAALENRLQSANIQKCCAKERRHTGCFIWSYDENPTSRFNDKEINLLLTGKSLLSEDMNPMSKVIYQYNIDGSYIKKWSCVSKASKELKINAGNIAECAACKRRQSAGDFRWSYKFMKQLPPYTKNKPSTIFKKGENTKSIVQLSLLDVKIKKWNSITEASKTLNINGSSISRVLKGNLKKAGGYHWKYSD